MTSPKEAGFPQQICIAIGVQESWGFKRGKRLASIFAKTVMTRVCHEV